MRRRSQSGHGNQTRGTGHPPEARAMTKTVREASPDVVIAVPALLP